MSLHEIAKIMIDQARENGLARQSLSSRGLHLTLHYRHAGRQEIWSLSLTRRALRPGLQEQAICRQYFGVPKEADQMSFREGVYCVVRFTWVGGGKGEVEAAGPTQLGFDLEAV